MAIVYNKITGTPDDSVKVLKMSTTQQGNAGSAGVTLLDSYTLPGGTMGPNDALRITTLWSCDNTANAKTAVIYFGSGATDVLSNSLISEDSMQNIVMIYNNGTLSSQKCFTKSMQEGMSFREMASVNQSYSVDTSADVTIGFQAESMTATENLYIESYIIELIRAS